FAGLISSFDVGDWYSVQPPRVINELTDTQIQVDLPIRCYGDVNGSYIPPIKSAGLNYRQEGLVSAQSDIVTLPVSTDQVVRLGAVSLELLMPEKSQVIDVMMADGQQAFFSQDGRILRLAWFSLEGIETGNSHPFMFINLKMETSAADASLEVLSNSSLGDMYGEEMKHIGLIFPGIAANQTGISTYPNPVSQTLNLDININQAQDVSIELFNMLGEKVISVDMGYLTIGLHHHVLDVTTLSKGSYLLRMRGSLESVTHKISISR
ncbi:MAG TPA: T9SS type A sorting domain-containing protein, partial [Bacteroidales bacterium]|nr:T9SS type A sorting domain-containing protein [Bacteroidales bacterium]